MQPIPPALQPFVCASREAQLQHYHALLEKWNKSYNLIGPSTAAHIWQRHIHEGLHLLPLLPKHIQSLCDIGTGAGIPGLIVAMIMSAQHSPLEHVSREAQENLQIHLVEVNKKKCLFLQHVVHTLGLENVTIHQTRVETLGDFKPDVITARAFAPLHQLLDLAQPLFHVKQEMLLYKGAQWQEEIHTAQQYYDFDYIIHPGLSDQSVVLHVKQKTGDG